MSTPSIAHQDSPATVDAILADDSMPQAEKIAAANRVAFDRLIANLKEQQAGPSAPTPLDEAVDFIIADDSLSDIEKIAGVNRVAYTNLINALAANTEAVVEETKNPVHGSKRHLSVVR